MNTKISLLPDELLPTEIKEKLAIANAANRGDFAKYMRDIEDIFGLDPLPNVTKEDKYFMGGFIEGEGSLNVAAKKLKTAKFGLIIDPEFSITQHINGVNHLHAALNLFKTGRIRYKSGSNATLVFRIDNRLTLTEKVVPFLEEYVQPYSSPTKRKRTANFKKILGLLDFGAHKDRDGFMYEILPLWDEMRMQKGQSNEAFASLQEAQDYVKDFIK